MRRIVLVSLVAAALVACSSDTTAPSTTDLIADFEAASYGTVFTVAGGYDEDLYQLRLGNGLPDELKLTPEQEEKIKALVEAFKEANKADQEALKAIIREAKTAKEDGKSDAEIKTKIKGFEAAFKETANADLRAVMAALEEIKQAARDGASAADIQKIVDRIKPAIDRLAGGRKKLKEDIESVLTAEQKASGCLPLG